MQDNWTAFKDIVKSTAFEHLDPSKWHNQDWFDKNDAEIMSLIAGKNCHQRWLQSDPHSASKKAAFANIHKEVQSTLHKMWDELLSKKADEIQSYADQHNWKCFYEALKCVYDPQSYGSLLFLSADRTKLITDQNKILEGWAKHINTVPNHPSLINDEAIQHLLQVPVNHELDAPPTLGETQKAIRQLSNGKAPGADAILAKVYKYGGPALHQKLVDIFQSIWQQGTVLQDFKDALTIHLYKRKGNHQQCDNHHGISLLSITGKVLARVLLHGITLHLEKGLLLESQYGFWAGWGTMNMIFAARQLQEKCQEQRCDLYTTFVDLKKALDTVSRDGLWKILAKCGCPEKFISIEGSCPR